MITPTLTTGNNLRYYRDWENCDGGVVMENAKTIKRYIEIKNQHPDCDALGVFFAFGREQFDEAIERLTKLGKITDKSEIKYVSGFCGLYGTNDGLDAYFNFYTNRDKAIPTNCDPQEVYFYEYNNHESMYAWDGDLEAIKLIIAYWGADVAKSLIRFDASKSIDEIVKSK